MSMFSFKNRLLKKGISAPFVPPDCNSASIKRVKTYVTWSSMCTWHVWVIAHGEGSVGHFIVHNTAVEEKQWRRRCGRFCCKIRDGDIMTYKTRSERDHGCQHYGLQMLQFLPLRLRPDPGVFFKWSHNASGEWKLCINVAKVIKDGVGTYRAVELVKQIEIKHVFNIFHTESHSLSGKWFLK